MRTFLAAALIGGVSLAATQGPEGTAVVRGRVIDGLDGKPLARLSVRFSHRPRGPYAPGIDAQPPDRSAITGSDGTFEVPRLAAGDYSIYASEPGAYLPIQYGVNVPTGRGKLLTVEDGARLDVTIKAWRGATIAGHVVDERGRPIVGAEVHIFADDPNIYGSGSTDDRGVYEITRLRPGRYAVGVPVSSSNRTISSTPGRQYSSAYPSPYLMDRALRTVMLERGAPIAPSADDGRPQVYEAAFAGGSTTRAGAAIFTVGAGESRTDVDVTLPAVRGTRVAGIVSVPGKVQGTILALTKAGTSRLVEGWINATAAADGTFAFVAVPPGQYVLTGERREPPLTEITLAGGSIAMAMDDVIMRDPEELWMEMPIAVGDADLDDLVVTLRPGTAISGRIVIEDNAPGATLSTQSRILVVPAESRGRSFGDGRSLQFGRDGIVSMRLKPGAYRILSQSSPQAPVFKTAIVNGVEIGDGPLVIGTESISDIQFVFGRHDTSLRGAVVDGSGRPAARATVIVFPADRTRWPRIEESDRKRIVQATAGAYQVSNLPPGDYYAIAIDDHQDGMNAAVLERLVGQATKVTLRPGEPATLSLTVGSDRQ